MNMCFFEEKKKETKHLSLLYSHLNKQRQLKKLFKAETTQEIICFLMKIPQENGGKKKILFLNIFLFFVSE